MLVWERLFSQFSVAAVISVGAQATRHQQTFRNSADLWFIGIFAAAAAFMALLVYQLDKRFKFTHWERDVE